MRKKKGSICRVRLHKTEKTVQVGSHPNNPIIFPTKGSWDENACYKPFAIYEQSTNRWMLWYNGRKGRAEQIGLVIHNGEDLGF